MIKKICTTTFITLIGISISVLGQNSESTTPEIKVTKPTKISKVIENPSKREINTVQDGLTSNHVEIMNTETKQVIVKCGKEKCVSSYNLSKDKKSIRVVLYNFRTAMDYSKGKSSENGYYFYYFDLETGKQLENTADFILQNPYAVGVPMIEEKGVKKFDKKNDSTIVLMDAYKNMVTGFNSSSFLSDPIKTIIIPNRKMNTMMGVITSPLAFSPTGDKLIVSLKPDAKFKFVYEKDSYKFKKDIEKAILKAKDNKDVVDKLEKVKSSFEIRSSNLALIDPKNGSVEFLKNRNLNTMDENPETIVFSPNGDLVAVKYVGVKTDILIYHTNNLESDTRLDNGLHKITPIPVCFLPNYNLVVCNGGDYIGIWSIYNGIQHEENGKLMVALSEMEIKGLINATDEGISIDLGGSEFAETYSDIQVDDNGYLVAKYTKTNIQTAEVKDTHYSFWKLSDIVKN